MLVPPPPGIAPPIPLVRPRLGKSFFHEYPAGVSAVGKYDPYQGATVGRPILSAAVDEAVSLRHKRLQPQFRLFPHLLLSTARSLKGFRRIDIQQAPFHASLPTGIAVDKAGDPAGGPVSPGTFLDCCGGLRKQPE